MKIFNRLSHYSPVTLYVVGFGDAIIVAAILYTIYRVFGN